MVEHDVVARGKVENRIITGVGNYQLDMKSTFGLDMPTDAQKSLVESVLVSPGTLDKVLLTNRTLPEWEQLDVATLRQIAREAQQRL